jgi:hypothetical protein
MTPSLKKARALQIAGITALFLALLDDSYLHFSPGLFALLMVTAIAFFIISYRIRRGASLRKGSR